jgi:hypothetical protein
LCATRIAARITQCQNVWWFALETDSARRQTQLEAANGLEMKCFNKDGLMWIGAARNGILIRGVEPIESTILDWTPCPSLWSWHNPCILPLLLASEPA